MHSPAPWTNQKAGPWLLDAKGNEVVSLSFTKRDDAALIKAAPDLLKALDRIATEADDLTGRQMRDIARAAIDKATGR